MKNAEALKRAVDALYKAWRDSEGIEDNEPERGRVLRTGLSSLWDRSANLRRSLAALRFNPSREDRTKETA